MKKLLLLIPLFISLNLLVAVGEEEIPILKVGDTIKTFKTTDQHGTPFDVTAGPKYVLISFDMSVAKDANKQLADRGADYLPSIKAVYISNIYGMPKIARAFAIPKMRRYPHQIIFADAKGLLDSFPTSKDHVTVLDLDSKGKIMKIRYWNPSKEKIETLLE